jgi:hypothetical protein
MKIRSAVLQFFLADRRTDKHGEVNRRIFTAFSREHAWYVMDVELHRPGHGDEENIS